MFAPTVVWAKWWGHSLSEAAGKKGEEVQAKFVPGGFFFPWKSTRGVHALCMRGIRLRDTWRSRSSAFLNSNRLSSLFLLKYSSRWAMLQLEFRESNSKPKESHLYSRRVTETAEVYAVCTVGGDDVWVLTIQETRLSRRSTVASFSSKVLSKTNNAPTWV